MKKLFTIIAVIAGVITCNAQTLSPKATPTSGGYYNAGGNSLSWTMGETFNTTLNGGSNMLTQGEQQPYIVTGGCTSAPIAPTVTGPNAVCGMTTAIYTASSTGAVSYTWGILPSGMTYFTGYNSHSNPMKVTISSGTLTGNITATATNACGTSTVTTFVVTKKPGIPGAITATSLCGSTTGTFSIAPVFSATSYNWIVPTGLTIVGAAHGNSINVTKASTFIVGNVSVSAVNACGNVPGPVKTVYGKVPVTPAPISGATNVCVSSTGSYTTAGSTGATGYSWSVTGNATITGSGLTAVVTFGSGFTTGTLKVLATNPCGSSGLKTLALKAINCSASPIAVDNTIEETKSMLFNLYPNPTTGIFIMENGEWKMENGEWTMEVYDVLGNKVLQSLINNNQSEINISQFSSGIYFVRVIDKDSNTLYSQRVVKE